MACSHGSLVEGGGQRVCSWCGLVTETHLFEESEFLQNPLSQKSSYYAWRRSVQDVLRRLGISLEVAESIPRPFEDVTISGARKRISAGLRLEVLAAYSVLQRFRGCISSEEARVAGEASSKEWDSAACIFGDKRLYQDADQDKLEVYRKARLLGLPNAVAQATLCALESPRLECCDPGKVLAASAAESLGDSLAADIFGLSPEAMKVFREKYKVESCAADLTVHGLSLKLCVERCVERKKKRLAEETELLLTQGYLQPWWQGAADMPLSRGGSDSGMVLQSHLLHCSSCSRRAEDLGLNFLNMGKR